VSVDSAIIRPRHAGMRSLPVSEAFLRRRSFWNRAMRGILFACAALSVLVTVAIVHILLSESTVFFENVRLIDFLTDTQWTPVFEDTHFGILPLIVATLMIAGIGLSIAIPGGLLLAVYLSEYAPDKLRETAKPVLELIEAVPTVVFGYFALLFVTPLLQKVIPGLGGFNMLAAGLVMGIMVLPYTTSLSEDAMRAVPRALREGGFALGYSRLQVAFRIVVPAAFSGITAAFVLGMSRAVGETMVVAIAAGQNANLTFNPLEGAATITAYIVQMSMGDLPHGSIAYQSIFAIGLVLFLITLVFNIIGFWMRRRFREAY
jgi:phosphate transport system permease protein